MRSTLKSERGTAFYCQSRRGFLSSIDTFDKAATQASISQHAISVAAKTDHTKRPPRVTFFETRKRKNGANKNDRRVSKLSTLAAPYRCNSDRATRLKQTRAYAGRSFCGGSQSRWPLRALASHAWRKHARCLQRTVRARGTEWRRGLAGTRRSAALDSSVASGERRARVARPHAHACKRSA